MPLFIHGKLCASICRLAAVGNEREMNAMLTAILENASSHNVEIGSIPETLKGKYDKICSLYPSKPNTIRFEWLYPIEQRIFDGYGDSEFDLIKHVSGLYCALFTFFDNSGIPKTGLASFAALHKQAGCIFMECICTDTLEIGLGGVRYTICDGNIIEESVESQLEMAYVLYCRLYAGGDPADVLKLIGSGLYFKKIEKMKSYFRGLNFGADSERFQKEMQNKDFVKRLLNCPLFEMNDTSESALYRDFRNSVALHVLFSCDENMEDELSILSVLLSGTDDRAIQINDLTIADKFYSATEDHEIQTAAALFRLVHCDGLPDSSRKEYENMLRRRIKTALQVIARGDKKHWLEQLFLCGVLSEKNLFRYSDDSFLLGPECKKYYDSVYSKYYGRKQSTTGNAEEAALIKTELIRLFDADIMMSIRNESVDGSIISLRKDGKVISDYPETKTWSDIVQIFRVCGVVGGVQKNGRVICHQTVRHPNASAIAEALGEWCDISSVAVKPAYITGELIEDRVKKIWHYEKCFCVGLKKNGTVVYCGFCVGAKVSALWSDAKQVFIMNRAFGVVKNDGTVCAFGPLGYVNELKDVCAAHREENDETIAFLHSDGTTTCFYNKKHGIKGLKHFSYFARGQWLSLQDDAFQTFASEYEYAPGDDSVALFYNNKVTYARLNKYGVPIDYVHLSDIRSPVYSPVPYGYDVTMQKGALAVLYAGGNVRLFFDGEKSGRIVAKKAERLAVEDGCLVAYCSSADGKHTVKPEK